MIKISAKSPTKLSERMKKYLADGGYTEEEIDQIDAFGRRFKSLRQRCNLTQHELAKEVDVTNAAIGKYEKSTDTFPMMDKLLRITKFFNVSMDYLIRGTEYKSNVTENNVNTSLFHGSVTGNVIMNNDLLSEEATELFRTYQGLSGSNKIKAIAYITKLAAEQEKI